MAYADLRGGKPVEAVQAEMEKRAVSSLTTAAALPWQTLQDSHTEVSTILYVSSFLSEKKLTTGVRCHTWSMLLLEGSAWFTFYPPRAETVFFSDFR